jgi:hypothetical protein
MNKSTRTVDFDLLRLSLSTSRVGELTDRELSEVVGVACRRHNSSTEVHSFSEIALCQHFADS